MADKELSWQARWELDAIAKALPKLETEIKRLENALDDTTGVVQHPKPYPVEDVFKMRYEYYGTPEKAKETATAAFEQSQTVRDENQAIIASNKHTLDRLIQIITNAGLPASTSVRRARTRNKWTTVDTEWRQALGSHIPTHDSWDNIERRYHEWVKMCDDWRTKLNQEEYDVAEAKRKKKAEFDKEILRRSMAQKYGLDGDENESGFYDIIEAIIAKDKYLALAYYLERNRGDWHDGPSFAKEGLRHFIIETDTDQQIYDKINHYIQNWDGDGRIFRDCTWNYTELYEIVPNRELLADLQAVRKYYSEEW